MKKNIILSFLLLTALYSCVDDDVTSKSDVEKSAISALAVDNSNTLWVGTKAGLYKSIVSGYTLINTKTKSPVTALAFDEVSNCLWVGTSNGLSLLLLANAVVCDTISGSKLSNRNINSVYIDSSSNNWFGSHYGITRNNSSSVWQKEKFKKNLSGTITPAVFEKFQVNSITSWDGDYYIATNGQSVYRASEWNESVNAFSGASQLLFPYNGTALTDTMYVVFTDSQGRQWMGGRNGIQFHTGHDPKMDNTSFYAELVNPIVHCIAEAPDGKIWAGTENGISIFDGASWTALTASLPGSYINAIAFDKQGKAWIGTNKGLAGLN